MNKKTKIGCKIELKEAWLCIANDDWTMDEAVEKARELGNEILEIDSEGRRIKVAQGGG